MAMNVKTAYLQSLDPTLLKKEIALALKSLKGVAFESIAFTGVSGALVAPAVAAKMKKGLILVRKNITSQHSCYLVEGHKLYRSQKYIIIDDFPSTGDTIERIIKQIKEKHNPAAKCVGVYWYSIHHIHRTMGKKSQKKWRDQLQLRIIVRKGMK
jgi:adenine/guanine phosphoribosyltransferase-like PRPP-binding protein